MGLEMYDSVFNGDGIDEIISKVSFTSLYLSLLYIVFQGIPFETIVNKRSQPPKVEDMTETKDKNSIFMFKVKFSYHKMNCLLLE